MLVLNHRSSLFELDQHSKCVDHQKEALYEELIGSVKFDLDPKVKVKSNIVSLRLPVPAYMG